VHPGQPLVVAANRDEFHARPSAPAAWWADRPAILAGRDLEARGTWMGVSRTGRFAAVTNFRGALVTAALSDAPASTIVAGIAPKAAGYSGFNLLVADDDELWWLSNRGEGGPRKLSPGVYGLGNTLLDAPEVDEAKAAFAGAVADGASVEGLVGVLGRWRIVNPVYGTRCSTILRQSGRRVRYAERPYSPEGSALESRQFGFATAA
jgi:uncharacterized protein with NRDE domain